MSRLQNEQERLESSVPVTQGSCSSEVILWLFRQGFSWCSRDAMCSLNNGKLNWPQSFVSPRLCSYHHLRVQVQRFVLRNRSNRSSWMGWFVGLFGSRNT